MTKCEHDLTEREVACYADGLCPLCLQAEVERLKKALEKYGTHLPDCPHSDLNKLINKPPSGSIYRGFGKCTCGFGQALKKGG